MTEKKNKRSRPTGTDKDTHSLALRPSTGLTAMFDEFVRPFDEFFQQPSFRGGMQPLLSETLDSARQPILDIQDRGDHFSVTAELPGFTKDEVDVKVDSNGIELKAQKSEKRTKDEKSGMYRSSTRSYYQYLSLPDQVLTEKIDGTMKNGILELKLPKRASKLKDNPRRVDLE